MLIELHAWSSDLSSWDFLCGKGKPIANKIFELIQMQIIFLELHALSRRLATGVFSSEGRNTMPIIFLN